MKPKNSRDAGLSAASVHAGYTVPTKKECDEFNRAADAYFERRWGKRKYHFDSLKFESQKSDQP